MIGRLVVLGGGRGLMSVLPGLIKVSEHLTAIVATSDDSGSTGRLRHDLHIPALGDLRRCLLAAGRSTDPNPLQDLIEHRFEGTDVAGHTLGNLIIAAMSQRLGSGQLLSEVIEQTYPIFGVDSSRVSVLPATEEVVDLAASTISGERVDGQYAISKTTGLESIWMVPSTARASAGAVQAVLHADVVVLGPGSIFTSVIAAALPLGLLEAIATTQALKVHLPCLQPEEGETGEFTMRDQINALSRHGLFPDIVLASRTHHLQQGELPVSVASVTYLDLSNDSGDGDTHSAELVGNALSTIFQEELTHSSRSGSTVERSRRQPA